MSLWLRPHECCRSFKTIVDVIWDHHASAPPPPCRPISRAHILKLFYRIISRNVLEHVSVSPTFLVHFQGSYLTGTHGMQVSRENGFQHRSIRDVTLVWSQWESETWVTCGSLVANYSVWKCGRNVIRQERQIRRSLTWFGICGICVRSSNLVRFVLKIASVWSEWSLLALSAWMICASGMPHGLPSFSSVQWRLFSKAMH